mgnify:FL=1
MRKIIFFFLFFFIETKKIDIMNMEVRVVIMDSKLELFLNKINLPKEEYNYFNEGKILKIKSTKDKLNWDFIIETKE